MMFGDTPIVVQRRVESALSIITRVVAAVPPAAAAINQELQRRNYTTDTIRGYILAVEQFARYFGKSPELMGAEEIGRFQLHLLREKKLAVGTIALRVGAPVVLVADIGGGTSDFSIVRVGPERAQRLARRDDLLASHGVHIAGTDFDRHISLARIMPLLGHGAFGPSVLVW